MDRKTIIEDAKRQLKDLGEVNPITARRMLKLLTVEKPSSCAVVSLGVSQPVLLAENKKLKEILISTYQFLGDLPELNMNNYNEEEVSELNLGIIQIYQKLQPYYDEYFSKQSN